MPEWLVTIAQVSLFVVLGSAAVLVSVTVYRNRLPANTVVWVFTMIIMTAGLGYCAFEMERSPELSGPN